MPFKITTMKKIFQILLLIASIKSFGQSGPVKLDNPLFRYRPRPVLKNADSANGGADSIFHFWVGGGLNYGLMNGSITNADNLTTTFAGTSAFGGDVQLAYFFGKSALFGVTAGVSYTSFAGKLTEDQYSITIDNAMTDNANPNRPPRPFTQIISLTKDAVAENVALHWLSLPVTVAFKGYFSNHAGYQLELGAVYTLHYGGIMNSTNGMFDYEAIYNYSDINRYEPGTNNPNANEAFKITKDMAAKYNMTGQQYLAFMGSSAGGSYPVGTGIQPSSVNSTATFASGDVGFLVRAGVSWYVNPVFFINASAFFQGSSFSNNNTAGYQLMNEKRNYNTLLNGISTMRCGIAGLRLSVSHALFYKAHKFKKR